MINLTLTLCFIELSAASDDVGRGDDAVAAAGVDDGGAGAVVGGGAVAVGGDETVAVGGEGGGVRAEAETHARGDSSVEHSTRCHSEARMAERVGAA